MKALVTGSRGFMGSWLGKELKQFKEIDEKAGKSILNLEDIRETGSCDTVFHLAGISYVPDCAKNPYRAFQVNTFGTLNILEAARTWDAKIVFPSTYVYGQPRSLPVNEDHPVQIWNTYARTKHLAEQLILQYHEDYGLPYAILRFFNVYGPGQAENFLIPKIVAGAKRGSVALQDSEPKRDFTFVSDAVQAYLKAAQSKKSGTYNIGSGKSYSVREIAEKVQKLVGDCTITYSGERRKNEVMDCYADTSKAKSELGWSAKVRIDEGLMRMVQDG